MTDHDSLKDRIILPTIIAVCIWVFLGGPISMITSRYFPAAGEVLKTLYILTCVMVGILAVAALASFAVGHKYDR